MKTKRKETENDRLLIKKYTEGNRRTLTGAERGTLASKMHTKDTQKVPKGNPAGLHEAFWADRGPKKEERGPQRDSKRGNLGTTEGTRNRLSHQVPKDDEKGAAGATDFDDFDTQKGNKTVDEKYEDSFRDDSEPCTDINEQVHTRFTFSRKRIFEKQRL